MSDETNNHFQFSYSALSETERREVEFIKREYIEKTEDEKNVETLFKLDKKIKRLPKAIAILAGVCGGLLFGVGVYLTILQHVAWGIALAVVGTALMVVAYPLGQKVRDTLKKKHKTQIVALSKKILGDGNKKKIPF